MGRRGRWWRRLVLVVAVVAAAAGGWWGGRATMAPPAAGPDEAPSVVTATVQQASVGRTVTYAVTVTQPFAPVATNSLPGIVTAVGAGGQVTAGDQLYAVAGQGVYAVAGTTPFYRDLGLKASGADVAQLQAALAAWGFAVPTGGTYDRATATAVKAWQAQTGQPRTGTVPLGTVLAIPTLPGVVRLGDAIVHGSQLVGGEQAVLARDGDPSFALVLSPEQANLVPAGALVDVDAGQARWQAVVAGSSVDENGYTSLALTAPDGSLVCGTDCAGLAGAERTTLLATVHVVPQTSGPGVPAAAVRTAADGSTYVLTADGTSTPVTVRASGDGVAIVDGVDVGTQVVVLDAAPAAGTPGPSPTGGSGDGTGT